MRFLNILSAIYLFLQTTASYDEEALNRQKRFLIFPPTAPTRHQFIFGIGIPLDLESIAVTTGYVFKGQYFLPTTPEAIRTSPIWETKKSKRDLSYNNSVIFSNRSDPLLIAHREVYNADKIDIEEMALTKNALAVDEEDWEWMKDDPEEVEQEEQMEEIQPTDDNFLMEHTRWHVYKMLEAVSNERGLGGRACVLRLICETAEIPFNHKSGILSELIHILLTPSTTNEPISQHSDNEYFRAEQLGRVGVACAREFSECRGSILNIISSVSDPLVDDIIKIKV
ncbi:uncharacterized protein DMENIID0001_053840 [Sergentomyia squamirostris]